MYFSLVKLAPNGGRNKNRYALYSAPPAGYWVTFRATPARRINFAAYHNEAENNEWHKTTWPNVLTHVVSREIIFNTITSCKPIWWKNLEIFIEYSFASWSLLLDVAKSGTVVGWIPRDETCWCRRGHIHEIRWRWCGLKNATAFDLYSMFMATITWLVRTAEWRRTDGPTTVYAMPSTKTT